MGFGGCGGKTLFALIRKLLFKGLQMGHRKETHSAVEGNLNVCALGGMSSLRSRWGAHNCCFINLVFAREPLSRAPGAERLVRARLSRCALSRGAPQRHGSKMRSRIPLLLAVLAAACLQFGSAEVRECIEIWTCCPGMSCNWVLLHSLDLQ